MSLSDNHVKVLLAIHNEENHCVKGEDLVRFKLEVPEFDDVLEDLMREDLVEYEIDENTYYLAYEGFEIVEAWQEAESPIPADDGPEYIIAFKTRKDFKRLALWIVLAFAVFGGLTLYMNPDFGLKKSTDKREQIPADMLEEMENEIKHLIDSVQQIRAEEKADSLK